MQQHLRGSARRRLPENSEFRVFLGGLSRQHHDPPQRPSGWMPGRKQVLSAPGGQNSLALREGFKGRVPRCQPGTSQEGLLKIAASGLLHTRQVRNWERRAQVAGRRVVRAAESRERTKLRKRQRERGSQVKTRKEAGEREREGRRKRRSSPGNHLTQLGFFLRALPL